MGRRVKVLLIAAGAALAALSVWACGGGDGQSLEGYLEDYAALNEDYSERFADLEAEFEDSDVLTDPDVTVEDIVDLIREVFEEGQTLVEDAIEDLEDLDPPDEAVDAHEEELDTARELLEIFEDTLDELDDIDSPEELEDLGSRLQDLDISGGGCEDLAELAEDNDINVEINC
jgi:hypothetical protein